MNRLQCCVVKDLMPLLLDGALSEETAQLLHSHLEKCTSCREAYQKLEQDIVLPVSADICKEEARLLKRFRALWLRKLAAGCLIAALLVFSGFLCVQYVMEDSELFQPKTRACAGQVGQLSLGALSDGETWVRLRLIKEDLFSNTTSWQEPYLEFDNPFYDKVVVNSGNSATDVQMRILDQDGNIVLSEFWVKAGEAVSLAQLERNTPYIVEYKAPGDYYVFTFH